MTTNNDISRKLLHLNGAKQAGGDEQQAADPKCSHGGQEAAAAAAERVRAEQPSSGDTLDAQRPPLTTNLARRGDGDASIVAADRSGPASFEASERSQEAAAGVAESCEQETADSVAQVETADCVSTAAQVDEVAPELNCLGRSEAEALVLSENEIVIESNSLTQHELELSPIRVRALGSEPVRAAERPIELVPEPEEVASKQSQREDQIGARLGQVSPLPNSAPSAAVGDSTSRGREEQLEQQVGELDKFFIQYKGK